MDDKEKKFLIGEATYVSIGVTVLLIGATTSMSSLHSKMQANAESIKELQARHLYILERNIKTFEQTNKELKELNVRLGRIEGKLERGK